MSKEKSVLVIAPHPDDEILGLGGTIARFKSLGYKIIIVTIACHKPPICSEAKMNKTLAEMNLAHSFLSVDHSIFLGYPALEVEKVSRVELTSRLLEQIKQHAPTYVFVPFPDRNIDHKVVFDASMVVTRPKGLALDIKVVAAYETLSETHWNIGSVEPAFQPNWTIDITNHLSAKLQALAFYESQISAECARNEDAVRALAEFRGSQNGFTAAESFQILRKNDLP